MAKTVIVTLGALVALVLASAAPGGAQSADEAAALSGV